MGQAQLLERKSLKYRNLMSHVKGSRNNSCLGRETNGNERVSHWLELDLDKGVGPQRQSGMSGPFYHCKCALEQL